MSLKTMRRLGAVSLLVVGAVHLQQYIGNDYSVLPTIGPLFLLNAIGAGIVAIGLLAPIERMLKDRRADLAQEIQPPGTCGSQHQALRRRRQDDLSGRGR